jgi:hypothetical protein
MSVTALWRPYDCKTLRVVHCVGNWLTDEGRATPLRKITGTYFCYKCVDSRTIVRLRLDWIRLQSSGIIGYRTPALRTHGQCPTQRLWNAL